MLGQRSKGMQTQQAHRQARLLIGRKRQIASTMNENLPVNLQLLCLTGGRPLPHLGIARLDRIHLEQAEILN